jgi:hypothetical protein
MIMIIGLKTIGLNPIVVRTMIMQLKNYVFNWIGERERERERE